MRALDRLVARRACCFLVVALAAPAASSVALPTIATDASLTNRPSGSPKASIRHKSDEMEEVLLPTVLRPAPTFRIDLLPAFTKEVPVTLDDLKDMERHVKGLAARLSATVVSVEVGSGSGSGVIISADGLVLSAGHVCGAPDREVTLTFPDGKKVRGKTIGVNLDNDSGLLRITDHGSWPHAEVGDLQQARVGDWVLALGHPGGFDPRRSLVVRLGRIIQMDAGAIQTDCTISPGDSGGPLFDMHGRVIGIHSAISTSMAENYHVAMTAFYKGWNLLLKAHSPKLQAQQPRAFVGATGVDDADGCRLTEVVVDGPAHKAGLRKGDVVVKVDGREIKLYASFLRWVAEAEPGEILNIDVKRGDRVLSLDLKVEALPGHN